MTSDEWAAISMLLDKGFKARVDEPFDETRAAAYFILLGEQTADSVMNAIRKLIAGGQMFRPMPGEIVQAINGDVSVPTFAEFHTMIYGYDGVMTAGKRGVNDLRRRQMLETGSTWLDDGQRKREFNQAAQAHADRLHHVVGSFVARYGVRRLQNLEIDDLEYGAIRRRDLEREWAEHVEVSGHRDAASVAAGERRGELGRFDPVAYLRSNAPALEEGEAA